MATGTEVAVTKLFWALGYHVPENHIAYLDQNQLEIGDGASVTLPNGRRRPMRRDDIASLLTRANAEPDGRYRIVASKALEGRRSAASGSTARVRMTPTTSYRTSTGGSSAGMACLPPWLQST
jgi:hypothetical protein